MVNMNAPLYNPMTQTFVHANRFANKAKTNLIDLQQESSVILLAAYEFHKDDEQVIN